MPPLLKYILRRLLLMIPTLLGVTAVVFCLCQFVPGGPVQQIMLARIAGGGGEAGGGSSRGVQSGTTGTSEVQIKALEKYYGFDEKRIYVRYWNYLKKLARLDLGTSFRYTVPVWDLIASRFPISLYYGITTAILTYLVCIPLGILKATYHRSWVDLGSSLVIFTGYAIPGFALGALLLTVLSVQYDLFPIGGFKSADFDKMSFVGKALDLAHHSVLPLICYMIGSFATMTMLMKNSLMENLGADYTKTAVAMGATGREALLWHALRNSMIPLATSAGGLVGVLLAGSMLIERVFNIPGMGLLFFESIQARDYPVVMGITVIGATLMMVGNLLSDLCVAMVDPRVRFG